MKQNTNKKVLSLFLVFAILLSYLPVTIWAVDSSTDITAIERPAGISIVEDYDDYIGENWLNELGLPTEVTVTLADGSTAQAAVIWDTISLDPRTPGYYFLPGTVTLPDGATNSKNLDVSITIQVREYVNLFTNGSFETVGNGQPTGWYIAGAGGTTLGYSSEYPLTGSKAAQPRTATATTKERTSYNYSGEESPANVAVRVAGEGAGQYYFAISARKGESDIEVTFYPYLNYRCGTQTSTPSSQKHKGSTLTLTDAYQRADGIVELPGDITYAQMQFTFKKTDTTTSYNTIGVYADDAELVALKVALKVEPANIAEVTSQIQSRFVAINYDQYAGENWQESLGLPKTVEVLTDKGTTGSVGVTWNYSALDLTKCGKYTLTGTLDSDGFPNPKGLTVKQYIYVCNPENLISNSSFEEGSTGWSWSSHYAINGTPAADGNYAFQVRSSATSASSSYHMLFINSTQQKELPVRVTEAGVGQYWLSAQVRDYLKKDEVAHTDELSVKLVLRYKTDLNATSASSKGESASVTISNEEYVTVGGIFDMTGDEVWLRPDLYLNSATSFTAQWILVDDVQLFPLNVLIPFGEEPADISEVTGEIPVRAVVQNYDDYVGANWQEALGLPATVEVKTSKGLTAEAGVIWDYSPLNLDKIGQYTLVGTLDSSLYPNPDNLYVTQIIYVTAYKNLLTNGSFESGVSGWGWGSNYKSNLTPAFDGKYSVGVKSSANSYASYHIWFSTNTADLAEKVVEVGAGQYYLSAQLRDYQQSGEVTHADPLKMYLNVAVKTDASTSSATKGTTNTVVLNESYQQASSIFNLNGDENWLRINSYLTSDSKFSDQWIMLDKFELVPLTYVVQQFEGAMQEVQTVIPARNIILNYPDYIEGYTTADLLFPETVEVLSTEGEIVKVGVNWDYDSLDLSKVGTYNIVGALEDMKIANSNGLSVTQVVHVVNYENLFNEDRGGFENGTSGWNHSTNLSAVNTASPKLEGDYSLEVAIGRLDNYKSSWLQALYTSGMTTVGQAVTQTGAGRYFFGVNAQGSESSADLAFHVRLLYKNVAMGDATTSTSTGQYDLSENEFTQASGIVTMPGDVTWTRMDIYFNGTVEEMRLSTLYLDKAELVPLNVEVPNMTDIIDMETPADIYVYEGTSLAGLNLPQKLEILLKSTQRFDVSVIWDTSSFDPNSIGEQTITGSLVLDGKYENTQKFVPTVKITVRAKGDDLRQTIYISTSGDEANDGLSPETPKKEIANIPTYLKQGYNVRLKRGDVWYMPTSGFTFQEIYGTEEVPLILGAYGSGDELPMIGFLKKIENYSWELVDEKRNVYAADVSDLGQRYGEYVHRCFVDDEAYNHKSRSNYVALKEEEFCSYDGKLYIRMPEGKAPNKVEVTPYGSGGNRLSFTNVSNLTIEYIHFKGSSAINSMMSFQAPTEHLKLQYLSITHCFYYIMSWEASDERVHYMPEISNCYIDACLSEEEGAKNYDGHWNVGIIEGITMRDGVEGAWVHNNHIRNMSHAFIAIESLDRDSESRTRGVFNCVIEDNLLEGGNALYARAFNINGGYNLSGIQMCRDNTWRRNRCYDMTTSSHLFGEDNLVYSNVFSYVHCEYDEDGSLFDGKSAQPYGFDVLTYSDHGCVGNILVNNTFYNVSSAVAIYDKGGAVYNSIFANNLIVNWTSDSGAVYASAGAIYDNTSGMIYVMNNGVYADGMTDHFVVDGKIYSADEANTQIAGYSGNIYADPKFVNADLTQMDKGARLDFTLSDESPMRYAGLSINSSIYEGYSAWERLKADYTDLNGTLFLAESPSIGAVSYSELIKGEVVSVDKLESIVARPGAEISQLNLPDTVTAVNDQGIDVVLLIDWIEEGFDSSKPGTVILNGQLRNGPHTELNVDGKTVSIDIQIKDRLELVSISTKVNALTVFYNTSIEDVIALLPETLTVVAETGFEEELPVTWICENYNPAVPETYTFQCVLPEDMITNTDEFDIEVDVRVMKEIGRGMELLINPDFVEGTSSAPWKTGWGTGSFKITTDPEYLYPGEPASAIVTEKGKYGSLQQDVTGQVKLLGDGKYLFRCYMRSYAPGVTINSSYACVQVVGKTTDVYRCRAKINIGEEWVEYYAIMDIDSVDGATTVMFHTSTGKTADDSGKSFVISGCSFIYLGNTDTEVEATMDSIDLDWNMIKGENSYDKTNVMSDLTLPTKIGEGSTIKWTSSDESVITNDGKVTMGRVPKTVQMVATITYNGIETVKKFNITVPRNPDLPTFSGAISGSQTVNVGDEFQVTVSLAGEKASAFNAYRFTFSFNTSKLEYIGCSDAASTVEVDGGKITVSGIGTERPITDTITLTFKAKKSGITEVKLVKVEMDLDANASLDNLPTMTVTEGAALIDVQKVEETDGTAAAEKDNSSVIWIVVGLVAAALICGGVIAIILIKKKKQNSST